MSQIPSISEVFHEMGHPPEENERLISRLIDREEALAESLRLNGAQFGAEPAIVSEVICFLGMGRPVSEAEREMIHRAFTETIERYRRQAEGGE